jgi:cell division septation protein DedD
LASVEFENNRETSEKSKSGDSGQITVQPATKGDSALTGTNTPVNSEAIPPVKNDIYCVVAGSFKSEANATALMKKLSNEGYTPELITGPNGFYRVSVFKCSSLGEAIRNKDSIGQTYSGTWVAKIK